MNNKMESKLINPVEPNKLNGPQPMTIDVSAFEKELPYLAAQGVSFEVIERSENSDLLTIRIFNLNGYTLVSYGIAHSNYGFDMAKACFKNRREVA
jgi:hypothetical protein